MRGKVYGTTLHGQPHRITPAYAGKREVKADWEAAEQDHPRLCGEKGSESRLGSGGTGSPPPMRGKVFVGSVKSF